MNSIPQIIEKLNNIKFKGLEVYNIGSSLPILASNIYFDLKMSVKNKMSTILKFVFLKRIEYSYNDNKSNIIFAYTDENIVRKDYIEMYKSICDLLKCDTILVEKSTKIRIQNIRNILKRIYLVLSWIWALIKNDFSLKNSLRLLTDILRIYNIIEYFEHIQLEEKKCLIVFCDVFPTDNILVQLCKNNGMITMTLQHAAFTAPLKKANNINDSGIELLYSIADYFLGWNQFTKEQAFKCGMLENKLRVVGIPKFINYEKKNNNEKYCEKRRFGVILGVKEYDDINKKVIYIANKIAEKYQMNYYLKYHPNFNGDEYNELKNQFCLGNINTKNLMEYIELVDFSVLSLTSMFIELIYLKHPIYRLEVGAEYDKFNDIDMFKFKDINDFEKIYKTKQDGMFEYLCYTDDVGNSYLNTINSIIQERLN